MAVFPLCGRLCEPKCYFRSPYQIATYVMIRENEDSALRNIVYILS